MKRIFLILLFLLVLSFTILSCFDLDILHISIPVVKYKEGMDIGIPKSSNLLLEVDLTVEEKEILGITDESYIIIYCSKETEVGHNITYDSNSFFDTGLYKIDQALRNLIAEELGSAIDSKYLDLIWGLVVYGDGDDDDNDDDDDDDEVKEWDDNDLTVGDSVDLDGDGEVDAILVISSGKIYFDVDGDGNYNGAGDIVYDINTGEIGIFIDDDGNIIILYNADSYFTWDIIDGKLVIITPEHNTIIIVLNSYVTLY
jgi:hypothetical protein